MTIQYLNTRRTFNIQKLNLMDYSYSSDPKETNIQNAVVFVRIYKRFSRRLSYKP